MNCIAVDDEKLVLDLVVDNIKQVPYLNLVKACKNAIEAIEVLQKEKIDLIFLDIKMPDISGIDFLHSLQNPPLVIFTTAYSEHAVQGFELNAIDYLLKPFSLQRFLKACNKALEQYNLRSNTPSSPERASVFIKSGYEQIQVFLSDILYTESSANYVQFVLHNQKIISRLTMNEAEALLPARDFIRIHRSYIVAKKKITKIDKNTVWVGQSALPVGASYTGEIEKLLQ